MLTSGTKLFLAGSVLLALATYVNSLSVVVTGPLLGNPLPVLLGVCSLFTTLAGSIAYCMGTLGYFPEFDAEIEPSSLPADGDTNVTCTTAWAPLTVGTNLYIIGAAFYVTSGVINIWAAYVKGRQHRAENLKEGSAGHAGRLKLVHKLKAAILEVEQANKL